MGCTKELGYAAITLKQKQQDACPYPKLAYETPAKWISRRDPPPTLVVSY